MTQQSGSNKRHYVISVGSNIEPEKNVESAAQILATEQTLLARSSFIETAPVGFQEQPDFWNGAFYVASDLDYDDLNLFLKDVEKRLGRVKGLHKSGPRTIDLDIIIADSEVVHNDFYEFDHTRIPVQELIEQQNLKIKNAQPDE